MDMPPYVIILDDKASSYDEYGMYHLAKLDIKTAMYKVIARVWNKEEALILRKELGA